MLAALGGCSDDDGQSTRDNSLLELPRRGPVLRGDVDGDLRVDRVSVRARSARRCSFVLVAETRRGAVTGPFRRLGRTSGPGRDRRRVPAPRSLIELDARAGFEVVVALGRARGALFTAWGSSFLHPHERRERSHTFAYEGAVRRGAAVDCGSRLSGVLVESGYQVISRRLDRAIVERRFYRVAGRLLRRIRTERHPLKATALDRIPFREFRDPQPFPSCTAVSSAEGG